jgi:hypothetical protein
MNKMIIIKRPTMKMRLMTTEKSDSKEVTSGLFPIGAGWGGGFSSIESHRDMDSSDISYARSAPCN